MDARTAVPLAAHLERRPHRHAELAILPRIRRFWPALPGVEATPRHPQTPTQETDGWVRLLRGDEPEPHRLCFAKKAAALFLDLPLLLQDAILFAQAAELLTLRARQRAGVPAPGIGSGLLDPRPERGLRQIEIASCGRHGRARLEDQPHGPRLELVTETPTGSLGFGSAIVDIVAAFRKVSTKSDQAQLSWCGSSILVLVVILIE